MLSAALTPKCARRRRSVSSSGAVVLVCTCVSTIAGITVLPARLTRVAPAGALTLDAGPTCVMRSPVTTTLAFSIDLAVADDDAAAFEER